MAGNTKPFSLLEPEVIITVNEEVRILSGVFLSSVGVILCMVYKPSHAPLLL
jgi:transcription antitermination factor NusG